LRNRSADIDSLPAPTFTLKAVLLDVDGTLLASNDALASAWSDACVELGFARDAAFFRPLMGMGGDRVLPRVGPSLDDASGTGKQIAERRKAIYTASYFPDVEPTRGAKALVRRFHDEGWTCVIATSATNEELVAALDRIGIGIAALRKADLTAADAFLLGDTPYDIEAAAGAGVRAVALRIGGWDAAALAGAVAVYADPQALLDAFDWAGRIL